MGLTKFDDIIHPPNDEGVGESELWIPEKFHCLVDVEGPRYRYYVFHGGRGGAKSWQVIRFLVGEASRRKIRVLCTREIQNSIEESIHKNIESQIERMGLSHMFTVQKASIVCHVTGSEFVFAGLRHNARKLKSYEDVDYCVVEEAASVSKTSWDLLIPTIRKPGSIIIVIFNPELDDDETYVRFVVNPPKNAKVVEVSYLDNPWFPAELEAERIDLLERDPKAYEHVWEGRTKSALDGAIFAQEIAAAEKDGRIGTVPRTALYPVDTYWDLGYGDATAIWFAQSMPDGSVRVIDYLENSGKTLEWYIVQLQQKGYLYGFDYVPHDAVDAIIHQKLVGNVANTSPEQALRRVGRRVRIAPKLHVSSRINAGRTIFPQCWFDRKKCDLGLHALKHYQWAPVSEKLGKPDPRPGAPAGHAGQDPLHDWASHGSDAYQTMAVMAKPPAPRTPPRPTVAPSGGSSDRSWMA